MRTDNSNKHRIIELIPDIRRYAFSLTGLKDHADDLLQKTVEKLLGKTIPTPPEDRYWAMRVCRNAWIDELRSQSTYSRLTEDFKQSQSDWHDGEASMINEITTDETVQAVRALEPELRETLSLVTIQGLSYADTAKFLDIPIGTVMSRISRARKLLVTKLY